MIYMRKFIIAVFLISFSAGAYCQEHTEILMRAKALAVSGQGELALQLLDEELKSSNDYRLYHQRAEIHALSGDYSSAIIDYNESNKVNSESGEFGLAKMYALKGDVQTSLYHLERNLSSAWKRSEKEILLDPVFGKLENKAEWRTFWKKERYSEIERKVSEIEFYTSSGKTADAEEILEQISTKFGGREEIAYSEALVKLSAGRPEEAVRVLSGIAGMAGMNERYLRTLARAQFASANAAGASETYSRLLQAGIADPEILKSRAECYMKTGETDKALNDLNLFLEMYPDDQNALSMAAKTEAVAGDNLRSIELLSRNIELHPGDAALYVGRGDSYFRARSWERAIMDYSMSLDLNPSNADAWLNKGISLLNSGKKQEACFDFRRALKLGNKRATEFISRNCIK
jgi:tetratricopeptide (TPR) repeat protein